MNIPIYVEKLYKYDLPGEPCSVAVPLAQGKLIEDDLPKLCVLDGNGAPVLCDISATATWPDGSVKYLFVRFAPDLPANKNMTYTLTEGIRPASVLSCEEERAGVITVRTGKLTFSVCEDTPSIFQRVVTEGACYEADQFVGPILKLEGKEIMPFIDHWTLVEKGDVTCILEGQGHYEKCRIHVRIQAYAGKEYVELSFRLFNDSTEAMIPDSWNFFVNCRPGVQVRTMTGHSNYKTTFDISEQGERLYQHITADWMIQEANEHFAEVFYGTFMADVCDETSGVCATVFQAYQNFPKAIEASKDGICVYLIPEGEEKVCFSSGMAREQKMMLHFHSSATTLEEIDNRSLIYQMPIAPWVDPGQFEEALVFPGIVTPVELANDDIELSLIASADGHGRAYGMMNWGDFPDLNYTAQGRGGGRLVWSNNEYDYPHAMFMMYARTGIRRFLDYGKIAAWHWMDVDVCHFSDDILQRNGQWEHTACHNGGDFAKTSVKGVMVCSHEWVEGLLDLYHFSGDKRALDTAIGIGENILALLETPMYQKPGEINARETGWALRSLTALYVETHDMRWVAKAQWIVAQFKEWQEKYGAWLAPYTDNTVIRVGFMISVAIGSLMRYYREFPSEEIRELIIFAVDDLIENGMNGHGLFYYKELPSLSRNGGNTLLLEAMYIGYELTGDKKYLEAGLKTFLHSVKSPYGYDAKKQIVEDAVLVGSTSPKGFAQSFLPMTLFYNAAAKNNLI